MRLKDNSLNFIVNFLQGMSWGYIIVAILTTIQTIYLSSIYISNILSLIISIILPMIAILLLEYFIMAKDRDKELKKQTQLLQQLVDKNIK